MKTELLIIGLDAATFDVIKPWVTEGDLPNLARLMKEGASGYLNTVPNLNSGAAWATFSTGLNPGKHGVYWFYEHRPDGSLRFLNGDDVRGQAFWYTLSQAGYNTCVINVPMSYPAHPLNGVVIAGLDAPGEDSVNFTYPPDLITELRREVGAYYIDTNIYGYARSGRLDKALQATEQVIKARLDTTLYLMRTRPWDVFVVVFTALDRVQHAFWHLTDPAHPFYDQDLVRRYGNVVRRFYQEIDRAVGQIVAAAGEEASTIILSDHGMGSNPQGYQFIDPLLTKLGYLHVLPEQRQGAVNTARTWGAKAFKRAARLADGLFSYQVRRKLMRLLPGGRARVVQQLHRSRIDWSRTKAYTEYVNPGIWINLQGRDERGVVAPGADYEALRDAIAAALKRCRDAGTGQPVVEAVMRREEVYQGQYLQRGPDLLVKWNYDIVSSAWIYTDEQGYETRVDNPKALVERRNVSGDHHPLGILIMNGRHIKPGFRIAAAHIADVPTTVLGMLKVQSVQPLDGRVLTEVFTDGFAVDGPAVNPSLEYVAERLTDFSDRDQALVEERLRDLGYLG